MMRHILLAPCFVAGLTIGMCGCDGNRRSVLAPSAMGVPISPASLGATPLADGAIFGVVWTATSSGRTSVSGAELEMAVCPPSGGSGRPYITVTTGADGYYRVPVMCAGRTYVWITKTGYTPQPNLPQCDGGCVYVEVDGETRFDIELAKQ